MNLVALETEIEVSAFLPVHRRAVTPDYFEVLGIPPGWRWLRSLRPGW